MPGSPVRASSTVLVTPASITSTGRSPASTITTQRGKLTSGKIDTGKLPKLTTPSTQRTRTKKKIDLDCAAANLLRFTAQSLSFASPASGLASSIFVPSSIASTEPWPTSQSSPIGLGSAVFHPEATRMARHAAAGQQGLAQGIFQIGGHAGYAMGPLLAAAIVVPRGQANLAWASVVALVAMVLMAWTGARYAEMRRSQTAAKDQQASKAELAAPSRPVRRTCSIVESSRLLSSSMTL